MRPMNFTADASRVAVSDEENVGPAVREKAV